MTTPLAVQPSVYYDAAAALHTAAENLFTAVDGKWDALADCQHMSGTYDEATKWAQSYDQHAYEAMNTAVHAAEALDGYAAVLREMGYNHALADYNSTIGERGAPPERPVAPTPAVYLCRVPLPSAGGPSNGLEDGGVKLAEKIGITVPNGDTGKLGNIATAWSQLAAAEAVANLPAEIDRVTGMFAAIQSPETQFITDDLAQLKTGVTAVTGAFGALAGACTEHHDALAKLREDLEHQLEDLGKELLKEVAITAAIGVATSFVTFGIGAAIASAKVAEIAARFAAPIRAIIDAWKAGHKLEKGIKVEQDLAKSSKELQNLAKLGEDIKKTPTSARVNPAGLTELTNEERWLLNRGPTDRNGKDLISAIRENRVTPQQQEDINAYNAALGKLPAYQGKVVRQTHLTPEQIAKYEPGKPITEDGYTCTSTNPAGTGNGVATGTTDVEYRITSKTGRDISQYGGTKDEVQFKDHTEFYVKDKYFDKATNRTIIVMDEI
ncbi:hypothetical protein C5E45_23165 [Nocardia nova]|uniref:Uncharacterized protein n=1 Tax=Nocardia nova TaxID=37330 RepID=A0A2S6ALA3_9NOCA|nr:hypothetical protein [Nocardia nova]PPJ31763.1 hypothetical protein C5E41_07705 [Nocardia nova]PPJ36002.1 hypothetical protein C5E45_23165 [Nocardia nova]